MSIIRCIGILVLLVVSAFVTPLMAQSRETIQLRASADSLLLGVEDNIHIQCRLPKNVTSFHLQSLYGHIENIQVGKNGNRVTADYQPPEQFFPAVDLVVISATDGTQTIWGATAIKLIGQGKAKIVTAPNATTHVRIGKKKFGPATADAKGIAFVDVQVPPGVTYGLDDEGNEVPLQVPSLPHAAIFAPNGDQINLDDNKLSHLLLITWNAKGKIGGDVQSPTLQANLGSVNAADRIGNGLFNAEYTVDMTPGTASIRAYDEKNEEIAQRELSLVAGENFKETAVKVSPVTPLKPVKDKTPGSKSEEQAPPSVATYLFHLALKGGLNTDFSDWWSPVGKLEVSFRLPSPRIMGVGLESGFIRSTTSRGLSEASGTADSSITLIPFLGVFWYRHPLTANWSIVPRIFVGAAISSGRIDVTSDVNNTMNSDTAERKLIFMGGLGAAVERILGPGMVLAELNGEFWNANLVTVSGKQFVLELLVGYRLAVGVPKQYAK